MRIKKELLEKAIEIQTITVEAFEKPGISAPEMERILLECLLELKEYRDAEEQSATLEISAEGRNKTNGENIRSMTDEKLADFLARVIATKGNCMWDCEDYDDRGICKECEECYDRWLKEKVAE